MNWNRKADNPDDESINDDFGNPIYCQHCGFEIVSGTLCEDCENKKYSKDREFDFCNH